jgi:hypothetical protein
MKGFWWLISAKKSAWDVNFRKKITPFIFLNDFGIFQKSFSKKSPVFLLCVTALGLRIFCAITDEQ